jgi:hypothetical protein
MKKVVRQDELEDIAGTVGQSFLGLTVNCARCHDHKFDPVRQVEYYRLTAALDGVRPGERPLPLPELIAAAAKKRVADLSAEIDVIEEPVRRKLLVERKKLLTLPRPIARWDFRKDLHDEVGPLHTTVFGNAHLVPAGLKVDGATGYAASAPLNVDLKAKTLETWVTLDNLDQRGGGVMSVQTLDGAMFDAIVYAERTPRQWMAGSDGFARTQDLHGPSETATSRQAVHIAIVYDADGAIRIYRNGQAYGPGYKTSVSQLYQAGRTQVLFGLRHGLPSGNRMLAGVIHMARLYDRALTAVEVDAVAKDQGDYLTPETITSQLSAQTRANYLRLVSQLKEQKALLAGSNRVYAVVPQQPETSHLLIRGNTQQPGETVSAGGIAAVPGLSPDFGLPPDAPEAERRKKLAEWITSPRNPLFARTIVNRMWHYHFGAGLVEAPNDLGFNGGVPTHQELLDWLARELVERRWSLKQLHRMIVTSATYRQSSRPTDDRIRVDAGNRLYWRKNPLRLEAEMVRDTMLAISGDLNVRMGGPGFQDFKVTKAPGTTTYLFTPIDPVGPEFNRRTLYRAWARAGRSSLLDTFDCPDPSTTAPNRAVTTTPLQALVMLNNFLVLRQAERFAERIEREVGKNQDSQVTRAYLLAFGRLPDNSERVHAKRVVQDHGLDVLTRAILNSNEFLYIQ